jgi:hypothetical protein
MKSFKTFLLENIVIDNPGGEWLKGKQEDAQYGITRHKGLRGAVTGYYKSPIRLRVDKIKDIPGSMGEEEFRNSSPKMKALEDDIGHPSKFDSKKNPIMIGVNHLGNPYVMEGNHRLAYAAKHGIEHIHTEVKYYNGGETRQKGFHPSDVQKMKA